MDLLLYWRIVAFTVGAIVGSFANVCIYRIPLSLNIVTPRSHCGKCKTPISWYENIPLLSYVWLRGRCKHCGVSIGLIHPFIELLSGIAMLVAFEKFGFHFYTIYFFSLLITLLIISAIDMDHRIIPDSFSIGGMVVGLALAAICAFAKIDWHVTLLNSVIGLAAGGGFLWAIAAGYEKLTGREGLGFGDVKLLGFFGAHLGIEGAFVSVFIGSMLGSVAGLVLMLLRRGGRQTAIPFGPFLSFGFLVYLFYQFHMMNLPLEGIFTYVPHF